MKYVLLALMCLGYSTALSFDGCKTDKFCFFVPDGCATGNSDVTGCAAGLVVTVPDSSSESVSYAIFTKLFGQKNGFVVAALSNDIWMGDDSVFGCVYDTNSSSAIAELSYNLGHSNIPLKDQSAIKLTGYSNDNGMFNCQFDIRRNTGNPQIFDLSAQYYIMLSRGYAGGSDNQTLEKYVHGFDETQADQTFPFITTDKQNLLKPMLIGGDHGWASTIPRKTQDKLVQVHASVFIIGLWVCMSVGYFFAAFHKQIWGEKVQIGGVAAWFQIHRVLMCCGIVCFIVGFICVFVACGHLVGDLTIPGHETQLRRHAILGITALILAMIQPFVAVLRCGKDHPYRPFFRLIHMLIALTIYGLGHGCIFYATGLYFTRHRANLDSYPDIPYYIVCSFLVINAGLMLIGWLISLWFNAKTNQVESEDKMNDPDYNVHRISKIGIHGGLLHVTTFIAAGTYIGLTAVMINMIVNPNPNSPE